MFRIIYNTMFCCGKILVMHAQDSCFGAAHKTDNLLYVTHKLISLVSSLKWKGTCLILRIV